MTNVTVSGDHAAGSTSITLAVGGGGSCSIAKGDIITFGTGSQQYAAQAARSGAGVLTIEPPLVSTVSNGTAVTVRNAGGTPTVNLAMQRGAMKLLMRQPILPEANPAARENILPYTDPETGLPLVLHRIGGYWLVQYEIAALWGCGVIDPRRGVRING
ncbi:MAG: hypothetical protein N3A38_13185 [Planctomycetota bacterium]|nr:hypothetical protein [Planctomycetota bacterium]